MLSEGWYADNWVSVRFGRAKARVSCLEYTAIQIERSCTAEAARVIFPSGGAIMAGAYRFQLGDWQRLSRRRRKTRGARRSMEVVLGEVSQAPIPRGIKDAAAGFSRNLYTGRHVDVPDRARSSRVSQRRTWEAIKNDVPICGPCSMFEWSTWVIAVRSSVCGGGARVPLSGRLGFQV